MPWRLRSAGAVLVSLHFVDVQKAREQVPPELRILHVLPGRTLGGLFLAEYGPGSDLRYNELIVSGATVWHRGRPAVWVTHLYVDDPVSVEGGRAYLGAPKHLVPFGRTEGEIRVGDPRAPICRVRYKARLRLWRQRVRLAAVHRDVRDSSGATAALHGQELRGRWGMARVEVEIPSDSPIRQLRLGEPLLGLEATDTELLLGGAPFLPLRILHVSAPPAG